MIELVVFDMAGTTVHDGDTVNASFRAALAGAGVAAPTDEVNSVMGLPKPVAIRTLLTRFGSTKSDAQVAAIHEDFVARMRAYYAADPAVHEVPGAAAAFAKLRNRGVKVALNTGFSRDIVDAILDRLRWRDPDFPIDATIASDEVPRGRPFPDMISCLMQKLEIHEGHRVAKVGDTRADLEEGAAAGCGLNIGVTSGSYSREELLQFPHTHILTSVAEVPGVVAAWPG